MVGVVVAAAELEVEDVDGVDLLDDAVVFADANLVVDGRGGAEEYALEEVALLGELHLNDDILAGSGLGLYIHAVALVLKTLLVALTLQYLSDGHRLAQEYGNQALKYLLVRLVAEYALDGPVETYVSAFLCHAAKIAFIFVFCAIRARFLRMFTEF